MDKKDILERAIDYQYQSTIWGRDGYSVAVYKLMMKNSGGIYPEVEAYRLDDQKSWKDAFEKVDKIVKLLDAGNSYQDIVEKDAMLWYDTVGYLEGYLGLGGLTNKIKNNITHGVQTELTDEVLNKFKTLRKFMLSKRKLINKIHDDKYRWAFHIVFRGNEWQDNK